MPTILGTLNANVDPKARILELINLQEGSNTLLSDVNFGIPEIPPQENRIRNTRVLITPIASSGLYGTKMVWYNRINGNDLGVIRVVKGAANSVYGLLSAINVFCGSLITTDDVYDATLPAADGNGQVLVSLNFKPTSLLFYGGAVLSIDAGFTTADRALLNSIAQGAVTLSDVTPLALAAVAQAGSGAGASRNDHVHPLPPLVSGSNNGLMSSALYTALVNLSNATYLQVGNAVGLSLGTASAGISNLAARQDHVHPMPQLADSTNNGLMSAADKVSLAALAQATYLQVGSAAPSNLALAANAGTATLASRQDHVHALPPLVTTTGNGLMSYTDKVTLNNLAAATYVQLSSTVPVALSGSAAVGVAITAARADHVHPMPQLATTSNAGLMSSSHVTTINGLGTTAFTNTGAIPWFSELPTVAISGNVTGIAGTHYLMMSPNITLTLPGSWNPSDRIAFSNCSGVSDSTAPVVDFGGNKCNGRTPGGMSLNHTDATVELIWTGNASVGLIRR